MAAVRSVIEADFPLSFHELTDPGRRLHVQSLLAPLLDALADRRVRSLELLNVLLSAPAIVEQVRQLAASLVEQVRQLAAS